MAEIVLIVEDEIALQETLSYNLQREGYEVKIAGDGPTAITIAYETKPDIILLDIMLPGMDGFEVCRNIRKAMNTPILMLTARDDEIDRVVGLEVGADDYLTKPFSMRELIARVKAMLRRVKLIRQEIGSTPTESPAQTIKFDNLLIDMTRHEVKLGDNILTMKPKEYDLLLYLANHRGQVLTRDHILQELWGWDYTGDSRTVDVHMRWLREKIESSPENPKRIITVRGTGYRFEG